MADITVQGRLDIHVGAILLDEGYATKPKRGRIKFLAL